MAGLDEKLDVCIHERHGHSHSGSIWQDKVGVLAETLDDAKDVVPSAAIQARRVFSELVDDLNLRSI